MTFSVRSLLDRPALHTVSLTPGVGEDRAIAWAHVCELRDPWRWLDPGTLVMTTGIGVPDTTDEQCAYLEGMHTAGLAALAVDSALATTRFTPPALAYAAHLGFPILQTAHEVPFVHLAMAVASAMRAESSAHFVRAEQLHGSLLLSELCAASTISESAAQLVAGYGVAPPFILAVTENDDPRMTLDATHAAFARHQVPALATTKEGQVLILVEPDERSERVFDSLVGEHARIGVSAPFNALDDLPSAIRQARSALIRNHQQGKVLHFEEHAATSLFLPRDPDQLRAIAQQVLGPLRTYDEQRSTSLTQTLRVFLEENRSWVRASERLFVHRQTLIARISRIEKIIDRDLSSMEDSAECWLAVQAAISCGDLEPSDTGGGIPGDAAAVPA